METILKESIQEKRAKLRHLSAQAKELKEKLIDQGEAVEDFRINDIIIHYFYTSNEHQAFNTFKGWIKEGFSVNKGEKGFLVWGRPKQEKNGEIKPVIENDDSEEGTFFPISHIFSNAQVSPLKKKDDA